MNSMNFINDVFSALEKNRQDLKNGDKEVIYYAFNSQFGVPLVHFKQSSDICPTLVIVWRNGDADTCQGFITGRNLHSDTSKNINGIWIRYKSANCADIILDVEKEPPVMFPSKQSNQFFMLFAQGSKHSQLCLYDSNLKGDAFSTLVSNPHIGHYLAHIASAHIELYQPDNRGLLSPVNGEVCLGEQAQREKE